MAAGSRRLPEGCLVPLSQQAAELRVVPVAPEALVHEAIGHAGGDELLPASRQAFLVCGGDPAQGEVEAIAREMPEPELVRMADRLQDPEPRGLRSERRGRLDTWQREPLPGHRACVLESCVPDVAHGNAQALGEVPLGAARVDAAFLDGDEEVLALARGRVERQLLHHEVLGGLPEDARHALGVRRTTHGRPVPHRWARSGAGRGPGTGSWSRTDRGPSPRAGSPAGPGR